MHILGLQPRDKAAMLVVNTKEIFLQNLHQNRVHFPAERNAFVLDHQHGRRDVTCKPAMELHFCYERCSSLIFQCVISRPQLNYGPKRWKREKMAHMKGNLVIYI